MIPKIIHQTWKSTEIPSDWVYTQNTIKTYHPDFEYILWTDDMIINFMNTHYKEFLDLYTSYKYTIQKVGVFRYFVLYHYGGTYVDLDIGCNNQDGCFNDFLVNEVVLFKNYSPVDNVTNAIMMSERMHPFMEFCINNLYYYKDDYDLFGKHLHVMNSTGPGYLTSMYDRYRNDNDCKNIRVVKKNVYGNCNICNQSENTCKGALFFFNNGMSWNELDSKIFNFCFCNRYLLFVGIFIISVLIYAFFKIRAKNKV